MAKPPDDATQRTATLQRNVGVTAATGADLVLHVVSQRGVETHPLPPKGTALIGRTREAAIKIDDPAISRRHALLDLGPPMSIEDVGSANGIVIAGRTLTKGERVTIAPGTVIELGSVMLVVQRNASVARPRRVWSHGYFEGRVEDECARGERLRSSFALVRVHTGKASSDDAADVISSVLRPDDTLATYGPGELEVLIGDASRADATRVGDTIVSALAERGVDATVRYACFPDDARTPDELLARLATAEPGSRAARKNERVYGAGLRALEPVLERIARGTINVLVTGETGVGKELVAELVHRLSPRAEQPLVRLNCAAFAEALLASELFGHERGAFTGADRAKPGILESADGGTVFLDEVGELPPTIQPKLLRVLEDKQVIRVGALRGKPVDVRFVSATNRDLEADVAAGRFRQDLYFRLNGFHVQIPPLRERPNDVLDIAEGLLAQTAAQLKLRVAPTFADETLAHLVAYRWPGNVRELRNVIERAVLLQTDGVIRPEHLPLDKMNARVTGGIEPRHTKAELDPIERRKLIDALAECGGNQTRAAKLLGIARGTLLSRMDAAGLTRPRKPPAEG